MNYRSVPIVTGDEMVDREIWENMNGQHDIGSTDDTGSEFSDSEGNYCINDDCCAPVDYFVRDSHKIVCSECGTQQSIVMEEQEWSNYADSFGGFSKDNSRCSYPSKSNNPFESECKTFIPKGCMFDIIVRQCNNEKCKKYYHNVNDKVCYKCGDTDSTKKTVKRDLSQIHMRFSYNHKEKSFNNVRDEIESYCTENYSSAVISTATDLWGTIMIEEKLTRGGVRRGLIASCVYYACIHHRCPRTIDQICKDFHMKDSVNFNKGNKEFQQVFETSKRWSHLVTNTVTSDNLLSMFGSSIGMDFQFIKKCERFYDKLKIRTKLRVAPKSAAAGVIYFMCKHEGHDVTFEYISKNLNVCIPTLTKTVEHINKLVDKKRKKQDNKR